MTSYPDPSPADKLPRGVALGGRQVQIVNVHLMPLRLPQSRSVTALPRAFRDVETSHADEIRRVYQSLAPGVPTLDSGGGVLEPATRARSATGLPLEELVS